ncbi:MAG TPA: response regulator [Steroidobacteraceae bacterium]|jgi:two-component system response regulator FixJ
MSISPTIVYVVDDDRNIGIGLEAFFRTAGLQSQSFNAGQAFLDAYPKLSPGCLFVDLAMPGMNGLELLERLRAAGCSWPVIILTGHGSVVTAADAMRAGAFAFLEKPVRELEVLATASRAEAYLKNEARTRFDEEIAKRIQHLSPRERQVLDSVLQGRLNKQIAAQFGISESTVKGARRTLMGRMQASTHVELVAMALRGGVTIKSRS